MLTIASTAVLGFATAAEAKRINSVKGLRTSCAKGSGTFTAGAGGTSAICDLPGGKTIVCNNKQKKCTAVDTIKFELVEEDSILTPDGVKLKTQTTPESQTWNNEKASVAVLTDVCASVGGEFIASPGGDLGTCGTKTATIVCQDTQGTCTGVAGKGVVRQLLKELIDSVAACQLSGPTEPSRPPTESTTTTTTTPTEPTTTSTTGPSLL